MFTLFKPRCPLNPVEKTWIEYRVSWLLEHLKPDRVQSFQTILPTAEFFPLPYEGKPEQLQAVFECVCRYVNVDFTLFRLHVFDESTDPRKLPAMQKWTEWERGSSFEFYEGFSCEPHHAEDSSNADAPHATLHVHRDMTGDLELMISLFSRELSQYLLLQWPDSPQDQTEFKHTMELMPLFFGLGIFGANAVMRERSEVLMGLHSWSMVNYSGLPSRHIGYALALLCWLRNEPVPAWKSHLRKDAEETLKASLKYLEKTGDTILERESFAKPYEQRSLPVWLEDLQQGTPGRRVAALWAIQSYPKLVSPGEQVAFISENLLHHDPHVRSSAAQTLDVLGDTAQQAVPALLTALEDRHGSVRIMAALALGKMTSRAEEIIPDLLPFLNDRNLNVANAAAWSLGQFGQKAEDAGPAIVRLLRRGILHCEEGTLNDILDALLSVTSHPEEVIMETLLNRDAETCELALRC